MAYAWDAPAEGGGRVDAYQGLQLRVRPSDALDFRTHFRFARRYDRLTAGYEWDEKVYQAYADARIAGRTLVARVGRQFMYRGAVNGTFDAVSARFQPKGGWDVQAMAGLAAPTDRSFNRLVWDEGGALGIYAGKSVGSALRASVSYFHRIRSGDTAWSIAGGGLSLRLADDSFLQSELDYNLEQESVQRFRGRAWTEVGRFIFSGEVGVQKPQIYQDSFFSIFELEGYRQARGGVAYKLGSVRLGYEFIGTSFDDADEAGGESETSGESLVTLSNKFGTVGVVYQGGYGGDRLDLYADARIEVTDAITFALRASRLEYERRSIALDEDATAFSAGVTYRSAFPLWFQVEAQRSHNSRFDQDTRLFVRAGYTL